VVTQGDAKLHLKINLCHMKRLSELMNENLSTLNDIFSDSSLSDAAKIRKTRSTANLLNRCFGQIDVDNGEVKELEKLTAASASRNTLVYKKYRHIVSLSELMYVVSIDLKENLSSSPGCEWQLKYFGK
jgi:hypothetical protein